MEPNRHIPRDPAFLLITQGSFKAELLSGAVRSVRSSCGAVSTKGRRWSCPCPALRHASDARHPILPSAVPGGPRATRGHRRASGGAIAAGRRIRAAPQAPTPLPAAWGRGHVPGPCPRAPLALCPPASRRARGGCLRSAGLLAEVQGEGRSAAVEWRGQEGALGAGVWAAGRGFAPLGSCAKRLVRGAVTQPPHAVQWLRGSDKMNKCIAL